ncbi:MAG: metallophosphoesterase [Myxococcales bacterium]|nr:metallophosphoesterase [Myxococcales bacterium]
MSRRRPAPDHAAPRPAPRAACWRSRSRSRPAAARPASSARRAPSPSAGPAPAPASAPASATPSASATPALAEASAPNEADAAPPTRLPAAKRVVAIGDVHGDLEATRAALRLAGAIDERDAWIGGDLVVVQTGDQLDRGDDERAILDLLGHLEGEAKAAGGALITLNGNHELMNVAGDLRYVTAGGLLDFAEVPGVKLDDPRGQGVPSQVRGRFLAFAPGAPYARRFAGRNVIQVVGDTVFVHGGVLPKHVRRGLEAINAETQAWLRGEAEAPTEVVVDEESPVWTRLYSDHPDAAACATLGEALAAIPAARMVVGHTVQREGIRSECDGKVWLIDVGMAAYYGGHPEALEIVGDQVRALR